MREHRDDEETTQRRRREKAVYQAASLVSGPVGKHCAQALGLASLLSAITRPDPRQGRPDPKQVFLVLSHDQTQGKADQTQGKSS
jgi:hypothetical protein